MEYSFINHEGFVTSKHQIDVKHDEGIAIKPTSRC
jgi:hypothetical protein